MTTVATVETSTRSKIIKNHVNLQNLMKCCSRDQTPSQHYYLHPHLSLSTSRWQLLMALLGDSLAIKACSFPWNLDCFDVPCPLHSVIAAQKMRLSYTKLLVMGCQLFAKGTFWKIIFENS